MAPEPVCSATMATVIVDGAASGKVGSFERRVPQIRATCGGVAAVGRDGACAGLPNRRDPQRRNNRVVCFVNTASFPRGGQCAPAPAWHCFSHQVFKIATIA